MCDLITDTMLFFLAYAPELKLIWKPLMLWIAGDVVGCEFLG